MGSFESRLAFNLSLNEFKKYWGDVDNAYSERRQCLHPLTQKFPSWLAKSIEVTDRAPWILAIICKVFEDDLGAPLVS